MYSIKDCSLAGVIGPTCELLQLFYFCTNQFADVGMANNWELCYNFYENLSFGKNAPAEVAKHSFVNTVYLLHLFDLQ